MLVERRRAHAGLGRQALHRQRLCEFGSNQGNGTRNALGVLARPAKLTNRAAMPAGQQPVVHLAQALRLQYGQRVGPIHQAHQAQRGVSDFGIRGFDEHRSVLRHGAQFHVDGQFRNDRHVQIQHQRNIWLVGAGGRDLADGRHIRRNQQRIACGEVNGMGAHRDPFAAL